MTQFAPGTSLSLDERGLPLLSPSGAQTWRRCERRFGWRYLDGHREPEGSGARLGKAYHAALERYLLGSLRSADDLRREQFPELTPEQWTTLRRIVRAALASGAYPEPRPGVVVAIEQDLAIACEYASWRGRVDAILTRADRRLVVHDHKTTRDLDYALTDETLPLDPQGVFYPAALTHPGFDERPVDLQWTYVQTHGEARVELARATVTPSEAHERMRALDAEVGAAVRDLAVRRPPVLELAPSWDQCDAFGGCPHRERCGERPILAALSAALDRPTRGDTMSQPQPQPQSQQVIATFAERYGALGQPTPGVSDQGASQYQQSSAPPQGAHPAQIAPQSSQSAYPAPPPAPAPSGPPAALQAVFSAQPSPGPQQIPEAQPPAGPSQQPVYDGVNRPGGPATGYPDLHAAAGGPPQSVPATAGATISPGPAPSPAPQPAPVQGPHSAPQAQAPVPAPAQAPPAPAYPPPASTQAVAAPSPAPVAHGFALLVGCAAVGALPFRRVIPFEHVVQRAAQVLRERHGVTDFRLVDYGHGPGMLSLAIQGALVEIQVGQGDALLVAHLGPEWQAAGAALRAQAAAVIQGTVG